jgi:hypothetical protein
VIVSSEIILEESQTALVVKQPATEWMSSTAPSEMNCSEAEAEQQQCINGGLCRVLIAHGNRTSSIVCRCVTLKDAGIYSIIFH